MSGPVLPHGSPHAKDDMSHIKRSQAGGRSSHPTRSGRRVFQATPQANAAKGCLESERHARNSGPGGLGSLRGGISVSGELPRCGARDGSGRTPDASARSFDGTSAGGEGLWPARGSRGGVSAGHPPATRLRAAPPEA